MATQKIYTKTGDKGLTALTNGTRVSKNSLRIECYGTIDELNSFLGVCAEFADELPSDNATQFRVWIKALQNDLFNLGSDLATPLEARWENMFVIDETEVGVLEKLIDRCQSEVEVLRNFVLPGGTRLNSFLHVARTVCRRAERLTVTFMGQESINPNAVVFLNRLSDFLFVAGRWVAAKCNVQEVKWEQNGGLRHL